MCYPISRPNAARKPASRALTSISFSRQIGQKIPASVTCSSSPQLGRALISPNLPRTAVAFSVTSNLPQETGVPSMPKITLVRGPATDRSYGADRAGDCAVWFAAAREWGRASTDSRNPSSTRAYASLSSSGAK